MTWCLPAFAVDGTKAAEAARHIVISNILNIADILRRMWKRVMISQRDATRVTTGSMGCQLGRCLSLQVLNEKANKGK